MSTQVQTVQQGQNLSDIYQIMSQAEVHHVPVLNTDELVGMVSFTDMMQLNFNLQGFDQQSLAYVIDQQFKITEIMSQELTTLNENQSVRDAVNLLADGDFHSLPVTNNNNHLVGMVTSTDLIRYLKDQY
ncbi:MAG: CBS domain-containing protein [Marinicella sp.]